MEARVGGDTVMDQLGKIVTAELDEAKGRILATAQRVLEISEHALPDIGTVWSRSQLVEDLREFLRRYAGDTPSEFMVIGDQSDRVYDKLMPEILITSAPRFTPSVATSSHQTDDRIECRIIYGNKSYKKEIIGILTEDKILQPPVETR